LRTKKTAVTKALFLAEFHVCQSVKSARIAATGTYLTLSQGSEIIEIEAIARFVLVAAPVMAKVPIKTASAAGISGYTWLP
tara:strand:- start:7848 stop:8090 length:243 start_codon:yes stop_codon:yes gene_type:complete